MSSPQDLYKNGYLVKPSYPANSLYELLRLRRSSRDAIRFVDVDKNTVSSLTYDELFTKVIALAHLLSTKYKLKSGDAIALNLPNSYWILLFHLSAWLLGCKTVPLDLKRDDYERKKYKFELSEVRVVISLTADAARELEKLSECQTIVVENLELPPVDLDKVTFSSSDLDAVSLILFTSGTTAFPKGVELRIGSLLLNADGILEWLQITQNDRFCIVLPLHHINSTTMCLATLLAHGTIVLCSRYTKSQFWRILAEEQCTVSSIVPTICYDMLSEAAQYKQHKSNLGCLSRIQIGSAPVVSADTEKFLSLYKIPLVQGYGSTETSLRVTGVSPWDNTATYTELLKSNSIGQELKWNNVAVLKDDGTESTENELGEIVIRGPVLFQDYLKNTEATEEALRGDWFHSGDQGYWKNIDSKRYYFITGRIKELIIKGGVNVSPLVVENSIIKTFPQIKECYVVGAPDVRLGQEIAAIVVFDESSTLNERKLCLEQISLMGFKGEIPGLSSFESPKYILVADHTSLPTTSTGKVQRVVIQKYIEEIHVPIIETASHIFRIVTPLDIESFASLITIHNIRWGSSLKIDKEIVSEACKNGVVIGAFARDTGELVGSVFVERVYKKDLENKVSWLKSFSDATGDLKLTQSRDDGEALLLVSVSTQGKGFEDYHDMSTREYNEFVKNADNNINDYLDLKIDPVLNFHFQPKGGMQTGAQLVEIFENARPQDRPSVGYNVLLKYPELSNTTIDVKANLGIQLVEASFLWAEKNSIKNVYAYSRPAGFLRWLIEKKQANR